MLRVLLATDAPTLTSGYAQQTAIFAPRLARHCHLAIHALAGWQQGDIMEFQGIPVYPAGYGTFGEDTIQRWAKHHRADVVITLKDIGVFNPNAFQGLRWCPMTPIDHEPVPPEVAARLRMAYAPIAYAPNGLVEMRQMGLNPLYIPHGYDPTLFYPMDRREARAKLRIPDDAFVVGCVAVNRLGLPSRKAWPEFLHGLAPFLHANPNAYAYLHTSLAEDGFEGGVNLVHLARELGIHHRIMSCDQEVYRYFGFDHGYLNAMYNSFDVLWALSRGEGFGLPTLEAQACGVPVIVGGWAAQRDLCFSGWVVPKEDARPEYSGQYAYQFTPSTPRITAALTEAMETLRTPGMAAIYAERAVTGAAPYNIDTLIETHWRPALTQLERRISRETYRGVQRIVFPHEVIA